MHLKANYSDEEGEGGGSGDGVATTSTPINRRLIVSDYNVLIDYYKQYRIMMLEIIAVQPSHGQLEGYPVE